MEIIMNYEDEVNLMPYEYYMQECFELAKCGLGRTSPNPVVGAIVLDKNGTPVGKGYHKAAGTSHAEVIALQEAGEHSSGGTLIVSLEPCCHYGKTPPCTEMIIKSSIKEIIFSCYDPNPQVSGHGEKKILENNIKVIHGVLEKEGKELNKFFLKWITKKLPWVTLKQAQTLDGKIALSGSKNKWISSSESRKEVHKLRNEYDAVMVGARTVQIDNPELTVREIEDGRNPVRIIIDLNLITDPKSNVYKNNSKVYLVTGEHRPDSLKKYLSFNENINVITMPEIVSNRISFSELFYKLAEKNILSVLIEAGPVLAGEVLESGLVDEYIIFITPRVFGDISGISSLKLKPVTEIKDSKEFELFNYKKIGNDLKLVLRVVS